MNKITAFIPARRGSKGIPGKNIKEFAGKPLLVHSIEYALNCSQIDEVVVSTDDDKIIKILGFKDIFLKQDLDEAAELVFTDRKHLDNNPQKISKNDIVSLLKKVNDGMVFNKI